MKIRRFHITCRLIGSLKSGVFFDIASSSENVDHEIAVPVDVSRAARTDDSRRLALLNNGRALYRLIERQLVMIVDGRLNVGTQFVEIDRPLALESDRDLGLMRARNLILAAAGSKPPGDDLDGRRYGTAEQLAVEFCEIIQQLPEKFVLRQTAIGQRDRNLIALPDVAHVDGIAVGNRLPGDAGSADDFGALCG